jgi:tRNA pseudouridine38-40 synthase
MARTLKLVIEYDGTAYAGWQIQNRHGGAKTIQGVLEKALARILQHKARLTGAGRTDAGVHAFGQVAHLCTRSTLSCERIQRGLNALIPRDIVVKDVREVPESFHARYGAKKKRYRYTILNRPYHSALEERFSWHIPIPLDVLRMRRAAAQLIGHKDFKAFQTATCAPRSTVRHVYSLSITAVTPYIYIDIQADGFLYNMVRAITGTLVEIGRGRDMDIQSLLKGRDRRRAGATAPAKGLCLMKVYY